MHDSACRAGGCCDCGDLSSIKAEGNDTFPPHVATGKATLMLPAPLHGPSPASLVCPDLPGRIPRAVAAPLLLSQAAARATGQPLQARRWNCEACSASPRPWPWRWHCLQYWHGCPWPCSQVSGLACVRACVRVHARVCLCMCVCASMRAPADGAGVPAARCPNPAAAPAPSCSSACPPADGGPACGAGRRSQRCGCRTRMYPHPQPHTPLLPPHVHMQLLQVPPELQAPLQPAHTWSSCARG